MQITLHFDPIIYVCFDLLFQWFVGGNAALIAEKIVTTFPDTSVSYLAHRLV